PMAEPLRVALNVGVVRRALEREVERHLEPELGRAGDEAAEVLQRAELGMHALVSALGRADRPGAAHHAFAAVRVVVRALTGGAADRVDRRQVDDVEAEPRDVLEARAAVGEGAVPALGPAGAWKELVPRAVGGPRPLHQHFELARITP